MLNPPHLTGERINGAQEERTGGNEAGTGRKKFSKKIYKREKRKKKGIPQILWSGSKQTMVGGQGRMAIPSGQYRVRMWTTSPLCSFFNS